MSTDYDLAAQLKIDKRAVKVARNLATRQAKGEIGWAPQLRELIAFQKIAGVLGADAAAGNLVGIAPEEDRATVAAAVRDAFGTTVTPLALGARITRPLTITAPKGPADDHPPGSRPGRHGCRRVPRPPGMADAVRRLRGRGHR